MMPILLLTRPAAASARTRAAVELARPGVVVVESPVMEIARVPFAVGEIPGGVILTSENGAEVAAGLGLPEGTVAWCVGDRTAEVARAAGLRDISADGDAEALLRLILSAPEAGPLLHLRGEHARGDIVPRLRAAGRAARDAVVYRQVELPLTAGARAALGGSAPVVVPLYSPRSAAILARQGPFAAPLRVVAMSGAVARAATALGPESIVQIDNPDGRAMLSAILGLLAT
jgi:uroporphyrinogen-III synthase